MPGQDQSCAQRTGVATCQQFVQQNGAALSEACTSFFFSGSIASVCDASGFGPLILSIVTDWEVKSVKIYQSKS